MRTTRTTRTAIAACAAVAALLGAAGSAAAAPSAPPTGDGAKAVCKRAPKADARIDKALARLNGNAATKGSVARLTQRVANAKSAGHSEIETYLNDRLTFRKSLVPTLQQRQKDLKSVLVWCQANNSGTSK
ncbi:hypothetical protein G3I60_26300 [Streptomyces sp. SID13666]|uniref:hypothetical protein n=1 Tax=Streptomyces TaxID=1883 RepID=UPI0011063499|nr:MULTISPECIES: hypothetical protein [Streptomyces]MCZ4103340.1 hypothetical protein [Streptomyces sp. H39-C1]NEA57572.1 hypothetical protein [Streptomyces sp. SID13666]NEA70924.1 hypothetical protein [Streptomyces sp. SID13588]QNA76691.1 hypothetical protein C8250_036815 [Streptomyces sp. So13.3]